MAKRRNKIKDTRVARNEKTPVDLSKPLNLDNFKINDSDCFGREWKPLNSNCAACADFELCGTIYNHITLREKEKGVKKKIGKNFLDEVNFKRIPEDKLLKEIKENSGTITVQKVMKFVKHYSKCEDEVTLVTWLKNFKIDNNLSIKKGIFYV